MLDDEIRLEKSGLATAALCVLATRLCLQVTCIPLKPYVLSKALVDIFNNFKSIES